MNKCEKCGEIHKTHYGHPSCSAHSTGKAHPERKGLPCRRGRVKGLTVCPIHGGTSKNSKAAGARRHAETLATALVATYGRQIDTTATEALLEEVRWSAGHVAWLRDRVAEIEQGDLVWGVTKIQIGGDGEGITQAANVNVWLELYQRERGHLVKVCSEAIKAGVEERRVRLAETQGALVADVIKSILEQLKLSPIQQALVAQVVPGELRRLAIAG